MKTAQTIDYSEAKQIIDRIVEEVLRLKKAVVIAVADSFAAAQATQPSPATQMSPATQVSPATQASPVAEVIGQLDLGGHQVAEPYEPLDEGI